MTEATDTTKAETGKKLKSFIERIERLESEKKATSDDISEVYKEAGNDGFDVKVMRKIVSRNRKPKTQVEQEEAVLDLYLETLGAI
jgi:uncharacterized protein (UPF0335 family)